MALTTEQQTSHLSRLQREVLGWDYFTMGDGSIDRSGKDKGKQSKLKDVPNTFKDVNEYLSIFQPLVLEECAAQITRGDDDDESVSREGGASTIGAVFKTSRVDGFHVVQFILGEDAMRRFHDNDLILVSKTHPHEEIPVPEGCFDPDASAEKADAKNDDGKKTEKENDQSASAIPDGLHNVHALGYVDGRDSRNMMRVRFFLPDNTNSRVVGSVAVTGSAKSGGKKTDSKKGATAKGAGDNNGAHKSTSAQKNRPRRLLYPRRRLRPVPVRAERVEFAEKRVVLDTPREHVHHRARVVSPEGVSLAALRARYFGRGAGERRD